MTETEYLLTQLAEECAEVAQASCKALRFGLEDRNCDGPPDGPTNRERIEAELIDVDAVVEMLTERGAFERYSVEFIRERIKTKRVRIERFMEYARERGTLDPDCGMENCEHSRDEHFAFDQGVKSKGGPNPYNALTAKILLDAWEYGKAASE